MFSIARSPNRPVYRVGEINFTDYGSADLQLKEVVHNKDAMLTKEQGRMALVTTQWGDIEIPLDPSL